MSSTRAGSPIGSTCIPEIGLRPATVDGADAIKRIRVETWRATYRGLLPDDVIDRLRPNPERRRERLRSTSFDLNLVSDDGTEVVGFAVAGPERTKDPDYSGEVYAIYVLPAAQRTGDGRALIRECSRELAARGIGSLLVWVLRENQIGRGFYERLGGRPVREKPLEEFPGAEKYVEIGYGWKDIHTLLT